MANTELHARLLDDAQRYDPATHRRSLLAPYRDVILLWRAKYMSYEQISATLARNGLQVSPAAVGVFCRNSFTKAEIMRVRNDRSHSPRTRNHGSIPPPAPAAAKPTSTRGPRIARDDY